MNDRDPTQTMSFSGDAKQAVQYRFLAVAGLLGSMHGCHEDSLTVHAAVEGVLEDVTVYRMARAVSHAFGGGVEHAMDAMSELLANADDDFAKAVLGLALLIADHPDGRFTVENVLATSLDQRARSFARTTLERLPAIEKRAKAKSARASLRPA